MAWKVIRQDDNGNRYVLAELAYEAQARALAAHYEASTHKQLYEVVRSTDDAAVAASRDRSSP